MNSSSSMGVRRVVPHGREVARRPVEDDAAAHEDEPLDDVLDGAELVRDVEDRHAEVAAQGRRGATPSDSCDAASTPVVGSSSTSRSGSAASAFAMNARCCIPPESVRSGACALGSERRRGRSPRRRRPCRPDAAAPRGRAARAGPSRRARARSRAPRRRGARAAAGRRSGGRGAARAGGSPKSAHGPARRARSSPSSEPQQRRLAAAVRPGDRDELPWLDREGDVREHRRRRPGTRTRRRAARRLAASERLPQRGRGSAA